MNSKKTDYKFIICDCDIGKTYNWICFAETIEFEMQFIVIYSSCVVNNFCLDC